MTIHGLRIYPKSVDVIRGEGAPIFVHGRVSEGLSDFQYIFRPLAPALRGHVVAIDFPLGFDARGAREDPMPALREQYGESLVAADADSQVLLLRGDDFERWETAVHVVEGALLPVFREPPPFALLKRLYWGRDFRLTSDSWPAGMRAVLHMWDDVYWQLFTTERADVDALIRAHAGDPKLAMYLVELDHEYPNPSDRALTPAT